MTAQITDASFTTNDISSYTLSKNRDLTYSIGNQTISDNFPDTDLELSGVNDLSVINNTFDDLNTYPFDTTIIWFSTADLSNQYAGDVWLKATVNDQYSSTIEDTIHCQIDNFIPQITIEYISGELSGTVPIIVSIENDPYHSINIYGEYKRLGYSTWQEMSFEGYVGSGIPSTVLSWNTISDIGDGNDQILDLRLFAQDDLDRGDYRFVNSIIVDNNEIPKIDSLKLMLGGDHQTKEGKELYKKKSPLFHADKITKPLLIGQGANDPRVKQAESDQIVDLMKEHKIPEFSMYKVP